MTKKILFGIAFVASVAACTDDYKDWTTPQVVPAPDAVSFGNGSVSPVGVIEFADIAGQQTVKVCDIVAPTASDEAYTPSYTITLGAETYDIAGDGTMAVSDLTSYVDAVYGKAPTQRDIQATVSAWLGNGATTVKTATSAAFTVSVLPDAPKISENYYIVGGTLDWAASAASKEQKFSHSGANVYDDPIFTITIPAVVDGDTWFAIGDDEACDAIGQGDWSKLLGNTQFNGCTDMIGSLAPRSELGDDGSICMPASLGADYFKITLNMLNYTYTIEPIIIASQYYVVGAVQNWSDTDKTCMFTPHSKYVLSYTTKWTGAWDLKVWDFANFGNWDAAYGTPVDGDNSEEGPLGGSGAISAPSAEFYTFTIDLSSMTYKWTKLDNQNPTEYESISLIGEFNGWSGDYELTQVAPHNWHCVFTQENDGMLKYRANHDWGINWGFGSDGDWNVAEGIDNIGVGNGGNIYVPAGTYDVYLNDITNSMLIVAQ